MDRPTAYQIRRGYAEPTPALQRIMEAKAQPCVDCGETYHFAAMQLDHRDRTTRLFGVNRAAETRSLVAVEAEIAKCDVRCANCHAIKHYELGGNRI